MESCDSEANIFACAQRIKGELQTNECNATFWQSNADLIFLFTNVTFSQSHSLYNEVRRKLVLTVS